MRTLAWNLADARRKSDSLDVPLDAFGIGFGAKAKLHGEVEGLAHADGDRLAVQEPVRIACEGLKRMSECVAEIEERTAPCLLALVGRDDRRLGAATRGDGLRARRP